MYFSDVKAGQTFYYSVNFTPSGQGGGFSIPGIFTGSGFSDWSGLAQRIASAVGGAGASASVVGAGEGNITLNVTSSMDRASMDDLRGNIDSIVGSQSEIGGILGSMIRLVSSAAPDGSGGTPTLIPGVTGPANAPGPFSSGGNPVAGVASSLGLSQQQLLLIAGGLVLFLFLKK